MMTQGFQVTEEDIHTVFARNGIALDLDDESIKSVMTLLDKHLVETAALKHSTELEDQTEAALDEIERQMVHMNLRTHPIHKICFLCFKRSLARTSVPFPSGRFNYWIGQECQNKKPTNE